MSESAENRQKKYDLIKKIYEFISTYNQVILVTLANVGSNQVQNIRKELTRNGAELVIGKNTVVKKAIAIKSKPLDPKMDDYEFFNRFGAPKPQLAALAAQLEGKRGLIFTNASVFELKSIIESNRKESVAKVGVEAPIEVIIPPGTTGMDPSQIGFFHALSISTKINKGMIEILKEVKVLVKGQKVGNSEAALLAKMNLKPFSYGMNLLKVYDDGSIIEPEVFSVSPEEILKSFQQGASNVTALSLELGIVNQASVPHMLMNAFKNICAVSLETGYTISQVEAMKQASQNVQQSAPAKVDSKKDDKPAPAKAKEPEPVVEEEVDMGGLFGDF